MIACIATSASECPTSPPRAGPARRRARRDRPARSDARRSRCRSATSIVVSIIRAARSKSSGSVILMFLPRPERARRPSRRRAPRPRRRPRPRRGRGGRQGSARTGTPAASGPARGPVAVYAPVTWSSSTCHSASVTGRAGAAPSARSSASVTRGDQGRADEGPRDVVDQHPVHGRAARAPRDPPGPSPAAWRRPGRRSHPGGPRIRRPGPCRRGAGPARSGRPPATRGMRPGSTRGRRGRAAAPLLGQPATCALAAAGGHDHGGCASSAPPTYCAAFLGPAPAEDNAAAARTECWASGACATFARPILWLRHFPAASHVPTHKD